MYLFLNLGESPLTKSMRIAEKTEIRNNRNSTSTNNTKNSKEKHRNEFSPDSNIEKSPVYTVSDASSLNVATGNVEDLVKCAVEEALDEARKQW